MKTLARLLWLVPLAVHTGSLLAVRAPLPASLGAGPDEPGASTAVFLAEWISIIVLSNVAFAFIHVRLPALRDSMLSVPGKRYWLASPERRAELVERLRGLCETTLLLLNVFYLGVFQSIYQMNSTRPLVVFPRPMLLAFFVGLPAFAMLASVLVTMRRLASAAKGTPKGDAKGILFLCVANSARSQMAEGIARSLAPAGTTVWSAGSKPTSVRPEAVTVLAEIGIDISGHRSKDVSAIPASEVTTVVTLCGEEECPVFLGNAERLHWPLPDPAAIDGPGETRLDAFRSVRDELLQRVAKLF
jgi:arsenate reductase (thioredoxin)